MYVRTSLLLLSLSLALGCASLFSQPSATVVQGPGTIFHNAEAAAIDGLGWCMHDARQDYETPRLRIGVVRQVDGGFTYDAPGVANWTTPRKLEYVLTRDAVAHFQHYPTTHRGLRTRVYEHHSDYQRRVVDEVDPLHRPSYLLTPTLRVLAYRGAGEEPEVARLQRPSWREGEALAAR